MKEFKSKYSKDSKEYLVSYLINITYNRKGYDTIYKVEDLNIDLEKLSYVQRVIFINDMIEYVMLNNNLTFIDEIEEIIEKLKDELKFLGHLNTELFNRGVLAIDIEEETDIILQEDGGETNINEFLKSV